jgi:Arc/MetJ-type ribon-helix-helix transcriptional regulator
MQIQLSKDDEDWLQTQVAAGRYASLEEAIADAIDALKGEGDFAWAEPLIAEGLRQLDRGEAEPAEDVYARIEAGLRDKL